MTSLKMAACLTFLFFAKITLSYQGEDICLILAEEERIEFTTAYQCSEITEEISRKRFVKDPFLCAFQFDEEDKDLEQTYKRISFYDLTNKFYASTFRHFDGDGVFNGLFIDEKKTSVFGIRTATVEMKPQTVENAQITYTLFKNKFTSSTPVLKVNLDCEIIKP